MFKFIALICLIPALAMGMHIYQCEEDSEHLLPIDYEANFCETDDFCIIPNGSIVSFTLNFISGVAAETILLENRVHVLGLSIPIEQNVPGCEFLENDCPLTAGGQYSFSRDQLVESFVSNVNVTLQFSMTSNTGDQIICYKADMHIV